LSVLSEISVLNKVLIFLAALFLMPRIVTLTDYLILGNLSSPVLPTCDAVFQNGTCFFAFFSIQVTPIAIYLFALFYTLFAIRPLWIIAFFL